jgi:hypothetical protein
MQWLRALLVPVVFACCGVAFKHNENKSSQLRPDDIVSAQQKRHQQESQRHALDKMLRSQRDRNRQLVELHQYKLDAKTIKELKQALHGKPKAKPKITLRTVPKPTVVYGAPVVAFASAPKSKAVSKPKGEEEEHWSPAFTRSHSSGVPPGTTGLLPRVVDVFKKSALPSWEQDLEKMASGWSEWWSSEPTAKVKDDFPHALDSNHRVAVAVTGHLRTFILPGVYKALAKNVIQTAPGGPADVFLIGHTGIFAKSPDAKKHVAFLNKQDLGEGSSAVQKILSYRPLNIKYKLITDGSCEALKDAWKEDGIVMNRHCRGTGLMTRNEGIFMQVMWMDHAFHKIRTSDTKYSVIIRSRPDVGVFAPIDWRWSIAPNKISIMKKDAGGMADWFFSFPTHFLESWWDKIASVYLRGAKNSPDYYMFSHHIKMVHVGRSFFPAAIVRNPDEVECFRLKYDVFEMKDCEKAEKSGYFLDDAPTTWFEA